MTRSVVGNIPHTSVQLSKGNYRPRVTLVQGGVKELTAHAVISFTSQEGSVGITTMPEPEEASSNYPKLTGWNDFRLSLTWTLFGASSEGRESVDILHSDDVFREWCQYPHEGVSQLLEGVLEFVGGLSRERYQCIEDIVVMVGSETYAAWIGANDSLASWYRQTIPRIRYSDVEVLASEGGETSSRPCGTAIQEPSRRPEPSVAAPDQPSTYKSSHHSTEDDVRKAEENLDDWIRVQGGRRDVFVVHPCGRGKNETLKAILAAVYVVERRVPQAELAELNYMFTFLEGHSYQSRYLTMKVPEDPQGGLPQDVQYVLFRLNIPIMERLLQLMNRKGAEASLVRTNRRHFDHLFNGLEIPWFLRQNIKAQHRGKSRFELRRVLLERALAKLRQDFGES